MCNASGDHVGLAPGAVSDDAMNGAIIFGIGGLGLSPETGPLVEQYALRATEDGSYPVMKWGFKDPQGEIPMNAGDVWKYGTTQNPATRYTQKFLRETGLQYETQSAGTLDQALAAERANILKYLERSGRLPPGNKAIK